MIDAIAAPKEHMKWIRGAAFRMGSDEFYPEEGPVHTVRVDGRGGHPFVAAIDVVGNDLSMIPPTASCSSIRWFVDTGISLLPTSFRLRAYRSST